MVKVKFKVDEEDFERATEDQGDFVTPPKGYYHALLKELNAGFSKDDDGNEDKKKPRLEAVFEITGKGKDGKPLETGDRYGNIWDYVSFSKESGWKRAEFLYAFKFVDVKPKGNVEMDIDTDEAIGKTILIRVKHEKDRRDSDAEPRAKIAKMLRIGDEDNEAAFGDGGEADTDVDYGSGNDNPFGAEEEAGGGDYYTRAGLEEIEDLKALGEAAKEFDLDPNDSIAKVKGKINLDKTKAKLIDAILEAQGVGDNGGEDGSSEAGDEESPF